MRYFFKKLEWLICSERLLIFLKREKNKSLSGYCIYSIALFSFIKLHIEVLYFILYRLSYAHILIGSHLWSIGRQMTSSLKLFLILYYIKQIDSKLPCVCSVIDHRGRQNVVRTSVTHSAAPRVPLFCSYHILMSSVIYYWTDTRQLGIYLLSVLYYPLDRVLSCG